MCSFSSLAAYYITSMGAAIDFIEHCEVPADALKMASLAYKMTEKQFESRIHQGQGQGQGQVDGLTPCMHSVV